MSRDIAETSIFLAFLQKIERAYGLLKGGLVKILRASRTYTLMNKFQAGTRANFKYSFLGSAFSIKTEPNSSILDNSRFFGRLSDIAGSLKSRAIASARESRAVKISAGFKEEAYLSPLKSAGIILSTAVLVNILFSLALQRQLDAFAWIIRAVFLFLGIAGLSCNADWKDIKETSLFFKFVNSC